MIGKIEFAIEPGEHPFFKSYEDAKRHLEWLRGMKEMFLARRKELKAITQDYKKEGEWVRGEGQ